MSRTNGWLRSSSLPMTGPAIESRPFATTSSGRAVVEDDTPLETFLDKYSRGSFSISSQINRPRDLANSTYSGESELARQVFLFFKNRNHLPPIPSPSRFLEQERDLALYRYGLNDPNAWECIQRCTRIVSALFKCPAAVGLIYSDRVVVAAASNFPVEPGHVANLDETVCAHTALLADGTLHQIPDARDDWRFVNMPTMTRSYFGQPVRLSARDDGPPVPVAVLCLLSDQPKEYMSPEEQAMMSDMAEMISQQIVSNWQSERRLKEEKMRAFVSNLMAAAVLKQSTPPTPSPENANNEPSYESTASDVITQAAQNLRQLLDCDFAVVLDLHAFHLTWESHNDKRTSNFGWVRRDRRGTYSQGGEQEKRNFEYIKILGYDTSDRCRKEYSPLSAFNSTAAMHALSAYLQQYAVQEHPIFSHCSEGSPLHALLPPGTQSYISIPLFNGGQPDLLVLVSTQTPHRKFEQPDLTFVSNVTLVIQSHLTSVRLLQADAAKTTFLSVISHELRTPLHGILCQLELIREALAPECLSEVQPLLDTAECCGFALRDVLNDVLEFGKMELSKESQARFDETPARKRQTTPVDISSLATEVLTMSYGRRLQWQSVTGESIPSSNVEVNLVCEDLPCGWEAEVDVAGLRRVLFNLTSNALKYTRKGSITLEIREEPTSNTSFSDSNFRKIQFSIIDTGVGMGEKFQQTLFTPFSQEDSFSSGLGLSICQGILKRMNGEIDIESKLGVGTTVRVGLQLRFLRENPRRAPDDPPRPMIRKTISDGCTIQSLSCRPTPTSQPPHSTSTTPCPTPRIPLTTPHTPPLTPQTVSPIPRPAQPIFQTNHPALSPQTPPMVRKVAPIPRQAQVPRAPALPVPTPPPPSTPQTAAPGTIQSSDASNDVRVLVVDDNNIGRKVLTTLLKKRKVPFAEASDGLQALGVFRKFRPHLVWTDVSMPVMNGIESAKRMREIERELEIPPARIVAITGLSTQKEMKEGLLGEAAIDEWLVKGQADLRTLSSGLENFRKARRIK